MSFRNELIDYYEPTKEMVSTNLKELKELTELLQKIAKLQEFYGHSLSKLLKGAKVGNKSTGTIKNAIEVLKTEYQQIGDAHENIAKTTLNEISKSLIEVTKSIKQSKKSIASTSDKQGKVVQNLKKKYESSQSKLTKVDSELNSIQGDNPKAEKLKTTKSKLEEEVSQNKRNYDSNQTEFTDKVVPGVMDKFEECEKNRIQGIQKGLELLSSMNSTKLLEPFQESMRKVNQAISSINLQTDIQAFIQNAQSGKSSEFKSEKKSKTTTTNTTNTTTTKRIEGFNVSKTNQKPQAKSNTFKVRAIYDYQAEDETQIDLKVNQIIVVSNTEDENWWIGKIGSKEGYFPSNYVERVD
ncbi:proline-serine-threonine phosphatase interacting protein [Anaeramoeba ignava]|uniref:Proline-serine-threonine phosphatase interacting protein n=1 Tax=Anaeramoeba ignava TaxID=1746090 RepID=A0A9Q0LN50_ANAIG|nr:proline-serine-threonine phosphatase interacting protein [Anaeramoeba ignava]